MYQKWDAKFIKEKNLSIGYLELYALLATVLNWIKKFRNRRIVLFCDNISVVHMVNNTSSSCKNCMVLIRKLVLISLIENVRIYTKYVASKDNTRADMLSQLKIQAFKDKFPEADEFNTLVPEEIWPMRKLWQH